MVAKYPRLLIPTARHTVQLSSGWVSIPTATPVFATWSGQPPRDTYNGKQVLDIVGRPAFAELAILWLLNSIGWAGVWIDSYRGVFRRGYWGCEPTRELPDTQRILLERISLATGSRFGAWDVFCWRDAEVLFVECKRSRRDAIRKTQIRWLEAAIGSGLSVDDFLIVEWSLDSTANKYPNPSRAGS